jgi:hypothetical protein
MYVYALVDERPRRGVTLGRGISRRPLSIVDAKGSLALVEHGEAPEATTRTLVAHDRVIRRLMRIFPAVLPVRFGTTAHDRRALEELIAPRAEELTRAFDRVRDAVQFTLRVNGPPRRRRRARPGGGPGTRWLAERLEASRIPEFDAVREATRSWVREERTVGPSRTDRPDSLGSAYHLVARADVRAWRRAAERAVSTLPPGIVVSVSGPWPAYAFVESA